MNERVGKKGFHDFLACEMCKSVRWRRTFQCKLTPILPSNGEKEREGKKRSLTMRISGFLSLRSFHAYLHIHASE
jgi:hypothetical protein